MALYFAAFLGGGTRGPDGVREGALQSGNTLVCPHHVLNRVPGIV